jgi:hypothetical protein
VFELLLATLAMVTIGNGLTLAMRSAQNASSWLVAGAAFGFAAALRLSGSMDATAGLVLGAAAALSSTFALVIATCLKRERRALLDGADDAETDRLLREARAQRLARRLRARRGMGWRRHIHLVGSTDAGR